MRSFVAVLRSELRLFLREPTALFFNVLFPLLLLVIMGPIFGNEATPAFHGYGSVDVYVPSFVALAIGSFSLIGLPVTLATYREQGVLRRYRVTPMSPLVLVGAQAVVGLLVVAVVAGLLVALGAALFPLRWPAAPLALAPALVFATLSFLSLGFVLGSVAPTVRVAQAAGNALFFPMLFLSGAAMPRMLFPDWMQQIGDALPLTYVVTLLLDLWTGQGWDPTSILVLAVLGVAGPILGTMLFRWR